MGSYQSIGEGKRPISASYTADGIEDFGASLIRASEVEFVNLEKMKEMTKILNFPLSFFAINAAYDQVLMSMRERMPNTFPVLKEYTKVK